VPSEAIQPTDHIGGPYLVAALFCEKVLLEKDGVSSLIRVVDRWTISGATEQMPLTVIQAALFLSCKSGMYRGSSEISVTTITPSKTRGSSVTLPVHFEGDDDRGVNVTVKMAFPVQEPGVYWFEISLAGQLFTRAPVRVRYQRVAQTAEGTGGV